MKSTPLPIPFIEFKNLFDEFFINAKINYITRDVSIYPINNIFYYPTNKEIIELQNKILLMKNPNIIIKYNDYRKDYASLICINIH